MNNLYEPDDWPIPFWIDTISVPLEPEERKLAIIGLDRTYKEAERVLMLDGALLEAGDDLGSTEILMRIACSTVSATSSRSSLPYFIWRGKFSEPKLQTAVSSAELLRVISVHKLEL